jgi:hypothetical protein
MKIFKLILNCVLPTLLVFSIVLNVLLLCGFEIRKDSKELTPSDVQTTVTPVEDDASNECTKKPNKNPTTDSKPTTTSDVVSEPDSEGTLVYEDNNIRVLYLETQQDVSGVVHKIKIENNTSKTLTVLFTDVIINGQKVYTSGLTCENLLPETDVVEDFVLLDKDWEHFTSSPDDVNFIIKLVNSKSRLDWYESDQIKLTF